MESAVTVLEFEAWVSDNYEDLVKVAKQATGKVDDASDLLHDMIESICDGRSSLPPTDDGRGLLHWFAKAFKRDGWNLDRDHAIHEKAIEEVSDSIAVLGEDAFVSPPKKSGNQRRREQRARRWEAEASHHIGVGNWFYGQTGNIRWRYQSLRDRELFLKAYYGSKGESVKATTARTHHFGELGNYYTEFGQGVAL